MSDQTNVGAFCDSRVIVVRTDDPQIHSVHAPNFLGSVQDEFGPTFVVVGADVSDEKLERNADALRGRFGVTLHQLRAVRSTGICTHG